MEVIGERKLYSIEIDVGCFSRARGSDIAWDDLITLQVWVDKENSIEFPLDSVHYLYNYYIVYILFPYTYYVTSSYDMILWHPNMWLWYMTFII